MLTPKTVKKFCRRMGHSSFWCVIKRHMHSMNKNYCIACTSRRDKKKDMFLSLIAFNKLGMRKNIIYYELNMQ